MLWGRKTKGLYRLEGSVQLGGAIVRHGSSGTSKHNGQGKQQLHKGMQNKRMGDALRYVWKSGQTQVVQPVQDVHTKAHRKETNSILNSCTTTGGPPPKRVSFALDLISGGDFSSFVHKG